MRAGVRIEAFACVGMWGYGCVKCCVESVRLSCVRLCLVLNGRVWAVRITQRAHRTENQHIVGSQAHTNGFHHGAVSLSHSVSLSF